MAKKDAAGKSYTCGICGYRLVVDETCGCAEEHILLCCGQPMKAAVRKRARRGAAKKTTKKR